MTVKPQIITERIITSNYHPQKRIMYAVEMITRPVTVNELAIATGLSVTKTREAANVLTERGLLVRGKQGRAHTFAQTNKAWSICDDCQQCFPENDVVGAIGDIRHAFDRWLFNEVGVDVAQGFCSSCLTEIERELDARCWDWHKIRLQLPDGAEWTPDGSPEPPVQIEPTEEYDSIFEDFAADDQHAERTEYRSLEAELSHIQDVNHRNQIVRAGMTLQPGECVKLEYADGEFRPIPESHARTVTPEMRAAWDEEARDAAGEDAIPEWLLELERSPAPRKYAPPRIRQLCPMPMSKGRESTVWDVARTLEGWKFSGVYDLYDFLIESKGAGASLDSLIVLVGQCITRAVMGVAK